MIRYLMGPAMALFLSMVHSQVKALTFNDVVSGHSALDEISAAERERYANWAKEFARFYSGKDLNFLRTCSQELQPNPLCGLAQTIFEQVRTVSSPLLPKNIRQTFYAAVSALDDVTLRRTNCLTSVPALELVVRTSDADRLRPRALYWLWICSELEVKALASGESSALIELEQLEALAGAEKRRALEIANKAKENEVNKLTAELADVEKETVLEDSSVRKTSDQEKRIHNKIEILKQRLNREAEKKIDWEQLKISRELGLKLKATRRRLANERLQLTKAKSRMHQLSEELRKKYPFGIHMTMTLSDEDEQRIRALAQNKNDPSVEGWTGINPSLNTIMRTLESLIKPGANTTQRRAGEAVARAISPDVLALEPRFRLYFVALLTRLAQSVPSVLLVNQNLGPLLRDHNEFICAWTLMALFPLNYSVFDARKGVNRNIKDLVDHNKDRNGLNRMDPAVLAALIYQESGFNPAAKSRAGAIGLMQMLLATAKEEWQIRGAPESASGDVTVEQLKTLPINEDRLKYDLTRALLLGSGYFEALRLDFNGSYALALAAYNSGPGTIQQWWATRKFTDQQVLSDLVLMDADHELHASDYVLSIMAKAYWYHTLYFAD